MMYCERKPHSMHTKEGWFYECAVNGHHSPAMQHTKEILSLISSDIPKLEFDCRLTSHVVRNFLLVKNG